MEPDDFIKLSRDLTQIQRNTRYESSNLISYRNRTSSDGVEAVVTGYNAKSGKILLTTKEGLRVVAENLGGNVPTPGTPAMYQPSSRTADFTITI